MSRLTIYREDDADTPLDISEDATHIARTLAQLGVRFERWQATTKIAADATQDDVLAAFADDIGRLNREAGYTTADVVRLRPDHPERATLRNKFLNEHTHRDDEVRFFVEGSGVFYVHVRGRVYRLVCERGDLLRIPAGTAHWFDMGPRPFFTAIRLFTDPAGWAGDLTGWKAAEQFPRFDEEYSDG